MITPSFNTIMLQKFFDIFVEQSLILTDKLEKVGLNGNEVFFLQHMTEYTFTTACGKAKYFYLFIKHLIIKVIITNNRHRKNEKRFSKFAKDEKNIYDTTVITLFKETKFLYVCMYVSFIHSP